jgi:peptidyl-tRNA hydrolase, PTH1 family
MKLIVGLGNPGEKYARNRHNIGFMAVDELARGYSFGNWKRRFQGVTAEGQIGIGKCILLKPGTYMNESGRPVGEAMRFYKLSADDVIVVHDELDLKPGTVRVKTGGGNAGHNGLKSISAHIGNDYMRVRLGIGHPGDKALVVNYVLQDFSKADREWLDPLLERIARGIPRLLEGGDAAFLSEAARGRGLPPAAAKLNGAAALANVKIEAPVVQIEAQAGTSGSRAALGPVDIVPVAPISVIAAREGTGSGAVSKAVMLPEPERTATAAETAQAAVYPLERSQSQLGVQAQKKKRGFFSWWFHSRIRGGAMV